MKVLLIFLLFSIDLHIVYSSPMKRINDKIDGVTLSREHLSTEIADIETPDSDTSRVLAQKSYQQHRRRRSLSALGLSADNDDEDNPKIPLSIPMEFFASQTCSRLEFEQNVTATGLHGDRCWGMVKNYLCYGNCNSIYVPLTRRDGSSSRYLISNQCAPNEDDVKSVRVTLTCPTSPPVKHKVKIVQSCECQSIY